MALHVTQPGNAAGLYLIRLQLRFIHSPNDADPENASAGVLQRPVSGFTRFMEAAALFTALKRASYSGFWVARDKG